MTTTPGVFVLALGEVAELLKTDRPRIVKAWASTGPFWRQYKERVPDAYVIGRQFWRAEAQAAVLAGGNLGPLLFGFQEATRGQPFDAWVGLNEYVTEGTDAATWRLAIAIESVCAAQAQLYGRDYWALSMSTHNLPPMWVVEELAKDPNITGLSLHLYSLERPMQVEPEVARYRAFIEACPLPVLIGETGRDGIGRNIGWQQQGVTAPEFALEMEWLAWNIGAWAYTVFCYGAGDSEWR